MPRTAQAPSPDPAAAIPSATVGERLLSLRELGHALRTPLCAVIGFSEILAQDQHGRVSADTHREYAEIIRQSGLQMLELVNRALLDAAEQIRQGSPE